MGDLDTILKKLESADWAIRAEAARELAGFVEPAAFEALVGALYDGRDTGVTEAAMVSLLAVGSPEALDALVAALCSDDEDTAMHLYWFLGSHESPLAREVFQRYDSGAEQ